MRVGKKKIRFKNVELALAKPRLRLGSLVPKSALKHTTAFTEAVISYENPTELRALAPRCRELEEAELIRSIYKESKLSFVLYFE